MHKRRHWVILFADVSEGLAVCFVRVEMGMERQYLDQLRRQAVKCQVEATRPFDIVRTTQSGVSINVVSQ